MSASIGKLLVGVVPRVSRVSRNLHGGFLLSKTWKTSCHELSMWATRNQFCRQLSRTLCGSTKVQFNSTSGLSRIRLLNNRDYRRCQIILKRFSSSDSEAKKRNLSFVMYFTATGIFMLGMAYAGVPLYRIFCSATGLGGKPIAGHDVSIVESMKLVEDRMITVRFNADVHSAMQWNFKPQQIQVKVAPGETALAFYSAKNPTDKAIVGISTYNIIPFEAGQYFNKIQCFCFEEQRLNPHEQVDMPVFFFIDPEYAEDPKLEKVDQITLSYTFFEAKEGFDIPLPAYMQPHNQRQIAAAS